MDESNEGLLTAAEDVLKAVHSADASSLMNALSAFFSLCDSQPHEEGEHLAYGGDVGNSDDLGSKDGGWPETDQRKQARYFGER